MKMGGTSHTNKNIINHHNDIAWKTSQSGSSLSPSRPHSCTVCVHAMTSQFQYTVKPRNQIQKEHTLCKLVYYVVLYSIVCTQSIGLNQSAMSMFWFSASTTLTYTTHCLHPIENFIVIHRVYTCFCIHTKIHIARSASSRAHTHGMTNNLTLIVVYKQYTVCLYN